jgi:hypothetical protein
MKTFYQYLGEENTDQRVAKFFIEMDINMDEFSENIISLAENKLLDTNSLLDEMFSEGIGRMWSGLKAGLGGVASAYGQAAKAGKQSYDLTQVQQKIQDLNAELSRLGFGSLTKSLEPIATALQQATAAPAPAPAPAAAAGMGSAAAVAGAPAAPGNAFKAQRDASTNAFLGNLGAGGAAAGQTAPKPTLSAKYLDRNTMQSIYNQLVANKASPETISWFSKQLGQGGTPTSPFTSGSSRSTGLPPTRPSVSPFTKI